MLPPHLPKGLRLLVVSFSSFRYSPWHCGSGSQFESRRAKLASHLATGPAALQQQARAITASAAAAQQPCWPDCFSKTPDAVQDGDYEEAAELASRVLEADCAKHGGKPAPSSERGKC